MRFRLPDGRVAAIDGQRFSVSRFKREGEARLQDGGQFRGLGAVELVAHLSRLNGPGAFERALQLMSMSLDPVSVWRARDFHKAMVLGPARLGEAKREDYIHPPEDEGAWKAARVSLANDLWIGEKALEKLHQAGRVYAQRLGWGVFPCPNGAFIKTSGPDGAWLRPGPAAGPWVLRGGSRGAIVAANPGEALRAKAARPEAWVMAVGSLPEGAGFREWLRAWLGPWADGLVLRAAAAGERGRPTSAEGPVLEAARGESGSAERLESLEKVEGLEDRADHEGLGRAESLEGRAGHESLERRKGAERMDEDD
jgi:hypothetical protein